MQSCFVIYLDRNYYRQRTQRHGVISCERKGRRRDGTLGDTGQGCGELTHGGGINPGPDWPHIAAS
eukprot:6422281-Amphidinium_carterae.1